MPRIQILLTQYGRGKSVGGWDNCEDPGTNAGLGSFGNKLVPGKSVALTRSVAACLNLKKMDLVQVEREDGSVLFIGEYADRAEWNNPDFTDQSKWDTVLNVSRVDRFTDKFDEKLSDGHAEKIYASAPVLHPLAANRLVLRSALLGTKRRKKSSAGKKTAKKAKKS